MSTFLPIIGPRVILRSEVIAQGLSTDDVQRRQRSREWIALRPGAYVDASGIKALDQRQRHLLLIGATTPHIPNDAVLSHISAAALHGIKLWPERYRAVQITRPGSGGGHRRRSLHTFRVGLADDEVVTVNGYRVTSIARTVVDLARTQAFESGVVAADSALYASLTTPDQLAAAIARAPRRPGMSRAREVVNFADGRAESVGESRSRVAIWQAGLPTPWPQYRVRTAAGLELARTDFGWEEHSTIGEFDGAEKYGRLLRPGETPGDKLFLEKQREDRIREADFQVARWTWDELATPQVIVDRILQAFERARRVREGLRHRS